MENVCKIVVVYVNPKDYPGKVVVRQWVNGAPDMHPLSVEDTYLSAMSACQDAWRGLARFNRQPDDDRCIREVWL